MGHVSPLPCQLSDALPSSSPAAVAPVTPPKIEKFVLYFVGSSDSCLTLAIDWLIFWPGVTVLPFFFVVSTRNFAIGFGSKLLILCWMLLSWSARSPKGCWQPRRLLLSFKIQMDEHYFSNELSWDAFGQEVFTETSQSIFTEKFAHQMDYHHRSLTFFHALLPTLHSIRRKSQN